MSLKRLLRKGINCMGFEVHRYPMSTNLRHVRNAMLGTLDISLVLDVGANVGQYGQNVYQEGYRGRCVSFEPVSGLFQKLATAAGARPGWACQQLGLGDQDHETDIHVNDTMSSILPRSPDASQAIVFGDQRKERIRVRRLDGIAEQFIQKGDRIWLKMDVQGYELNVLQGARATLAEIVAVEAEMSVWAFYSNQPLYREMIDHLSAAGFDLWAIFPGMTNPKDGRLIEMDGIFVNRLASISV